VHATKSFDGSKISIFPAGPLAPMRCRMSAHTNFWWYRMTADSVIGMQRVFCERCPEGAAAKAARAHIATTGKVRAPLAPRTVRLSGCRAGRVGLRFKAALTRSGMNYESLYIYTSSRLTRRWLLPQIKLLVT